MLVWRDLPNPSQMAFREDVKHYRDAGILGVNTESRNALATTFINLYLRARLLWNPTEDVDALLDDFYARIDSKPSRRRAMAQPLDLNRVANAPIKLHALHPPPSAGPTQRDICCRTFAPALPENPAASVREYCSGAYSAGDDRGRGADGALVTHMLCCICAMCFSAAASSENDQGSMNFASNTASGSSTIPSKVAPKKGGIGC